MDGTVRVRKGSETGKLESGFIRHPTDQEIIPGAYKAIRQYCHEGWRVVGASNQGGVTAGKKSLEDCIKEQRYTIKLERNIRYIMFCPDYEGQAIGVVSYPTATSIETRDQLKNNTEETLVSGVFSSFRKPSPGMIEYALAVEAQINKRKVDEILFVGDRPEDEQAAQAANIPFMWAKDWWI
jgi:D-glycero-D-manno-heptose 1,7-bisphosphate phosphatase